MGWEKDLPPGEQLLTCRPLIEHLVHLVEMVEIASYQE